MAQKFFRDGRWVDKAEMLRMKSKHDKVNQKAIEEAAKLEEQKKLAEQEAEKARILAEAEAKKKAAEEELLDLQMQEGLIDEIANVDEEKEAEKLELDRIENLEKELRILPLDQLRAVAKDQGVKASWVKGKEKLIKGILELNK